ncbi:hypothetical protein I6E29_00250 [Arcanobacterium haemolyticum]|nr:hypothetical protein [Arcanobacterium haemolyticum]
MILPELEGITLTTGHSDGTTFIVVPDPDGSRDVTQETVSTICDSRTGIGADALIRVVRTARIPEAAELVRECPQAEWFMDEWRTDVRASGDRISDASARIFAHYLRIYGLARLEPGESLTVATRDGAVCVTWDGEGYTVASWQHRGDRVENSERTASAAPAVLTAEFSLIGVAGY